MTHRRNVRADPRISATVDVTYAGCPIVAAHASSSMSTTGGGQIPAVSARNSSGDSSSKVTGRPSTSPMVRACSSWLSDSGPVRT